MKIYSLFNYGNDEIVFVYILYEFCLYIGSEG